jgi:hypothetical protein
MNAAHTPGPWFTTDGIYNEIKASSKRGKTWVIARITAARTGHDEAKANARLIAASPDLLEALERLIERVSDLGANGFSQEVARGKAAIAKAKGGQGE